MKKYLLLFLLLFFPLIINAETCDSNSITIKSIEVISSSGNASEKTSPVINNKSVGLDLSMSHVNDSITYKLVIENKSKEDYEINNNINSKSNYIEYSFADDYSNTVRAKSTKEVLIKAEYKNEVPTSSYSNGVFSEKEDILLSLSTIGNPKTGYVVSSVLVIIGITSFICYLILNKSFKTQTLVVIIGLILIVPSTLYAACSIDIDIKSNVEIKKMAIFDTGVTVNSKMNYLSGSNNLKHFKRSNTIPDSIRTAAENGLANVNSISVTDSDIDSKIASIKSDSQMLYSITVDNSGKDKHYCYKTSLNDIYDTCFYTYEKLISTYKYDPLYYDNNNNFLIYDFNTDEYKLYTETEFRNYLRVELLKEKKEETLKNILSSDTSDYTIYGWFDNDTLYYYCEVDDVYLNKDSSYMFYNVDYLTSVPGLETVNTSILEDGRFMFLLSSFYADSFNINVSSWNTSNVTNMKGMFEAKYMGESPLFNFDYSIIGLNKWDTSKVTDMSFMFAHAGYYDEEFNIDVSGFNTSKVTDMRGMFSHCAQSATTWSIGNLSSWDTSNVEDMSDMFYCAGYSSTVLNFDLSSWNTSKVTNMKNMFNHFITNAPTWSIGDLSNWDTSNVTNMSGMFEGAGRDNPSWNIGNLSRWETSKVEDMSHMFSCAGEHSTTWSVGDISNWNTSKVKSMTYMFYCAGLYSQTFNLDLSRWDTSKVENMAYMFYSSGSNATSWSIGDISKWNTSSVINMWSMLNFAGHNSSVWDIGGKLEWDTSKVENMSQLFMGAGASATTFNIDVSDFNTSNVTTMSQMFYSAGEYSTSWKIGDLSRWDTSKVTDMFGMFNYAGKNATTWNSIGTLKIYNADCSWLFQYCKNARATLVFYKPITKYGSIFYNAATVNDALITVNYGSEAEPVIGRIVLTVSGGAHVVRGQLVE